MYFYAIAIHGFAFWLHCVSAQHFISESVLHVSAGVAGGVFMDLQKLLHDSGRQDADIHPCDRVGWFGWLALRPWDAEFRIAIEC
jgi:hypothetical protein